MITFIFLFLVSFDYPNIDNPSQKRFNIEISYLGLPGTTRTQFEIENEKVTAFYRRYDFASKSHINFDQSTFRNVNTEELYRFLKMIDWGAIPEKLIVPTIDGYSYRIKIELENEVHNFYIDNYFHPVFDTLFTLSRNLLPDRVRKRKYGLKYY